MNVDLSLEDCNNIVCLYCGHDNFEIDNYELKLFTGDINGYTCEHMHLIIILKDGKQLKFFAKKMLDFHSDNQKFIHVDFYEKEKFFYENFTKNSFAPKCFMCKDHTVVLEDLTLIEYSMNNSNYLDVNHIKCTLGALAKLHATSIVYEERKSNNYR